MGISGGVGACPPLPYAPASYIHHVVITSASGYCVTICVFIGWLVRSLMCSLVCSFDSSHPAIPAAIAGGRQAGVRQAGGVARSWRMWRPTIDFFS